MQSGRTFYDFQLGDVAFFVMDTRRYRSPLTGPDLTSRTLLGSEQLSALYNWLHKVTTTTLSVRHLLKFYSHQGKRNMHLQIHRFLRSFYISLDTRCHRFLVWISYGKGRASKCFSHSPQRYHSFWGSPRVCSNRI